MKLKSQAKCQDRSSNVIIKWNILRETERNWQNLLNLFTLNYLLCNFLFYKNYGAVSY